MAERAPSPEQVRAALDELLGWQGLSRSPQLAELLRYVVERTLEGEAAAIKAYSIAVDVFQRPPSFDPQSDPIVRVQARRLRQVLEQFYAAGERRSEVEIHLPLGRYVPEFRLLGPSGEAVTGDGDAADAAPAEVAVAGGGGRQRNGIDARRRRRMSRFFTNALLGLCFTLIGVALAIGIVRWMLPESRLRGGELPQPPRVQVSAFENLTGDNELADSVAGLATGVGSRLGLFEEVTVVADGSADLVLSGTLVEARGEFSLKALLTNPQTGGVQWSAQLKASDADAKKAFDTLADRLVRLLANAHGPLRAAGRTWLAQQTETPAEPNLFVCRLEQDRWRDTRSRDRALQTIACFHKVLESDPENAIALAGSAGISSWRKEIDARPGDQFAALLLDEQAAVTRAIALMPGSSFVQEQAAQVYAREGAANETLAASAKAVELNPNNTDAMASRGLYLALTGNWPDGVALAQEALQSLNSPPGWYYMTTAFDALRERRYFDAMEAAQLVATSDGELGPVMMLAAAPFVGRTDLLERLKATVLATPTFQNFGILARLSPYLRQTVLIERIRDGLVLAGLPPATLLNPFNADGTPKTGS